MPSRRLHAALQSSVIVAVVGTACALIPGVAHADSCATVDATGVCFGPGTTVPSETVGGPTTVPAITTPSESVTSPTTICLLVTCFVKGQPIATVPPVTTPAETVPVPQETTPPVAVPLGAPQLETFLYTCTLDFPGNAGAFGYPGEIGDDLNNGDTNDLVNLLFSDVVWAASLQAYRDYNTDCIQ